MKEYQSQFVTVTGEVNAPGRRPLRSAQTRLIDVLVEAGGLTAARLGRDRAHARRGRVRGRRAHAPRRSSARRPHAAGRAGACRLPLRAGDIITASPKYYVTVEGEVARPGRYVLDAALTVSGAISSAGGLTRFGNQRVRVRRVDPASGQP